MRTPAPLTRGAGVLACLPVPEVRRDRDRQALDLRTAEVIDPTRRGTELRSGERFARISGLRVASAIEERQE